MKFRDLFPNRKPLIGCIHLLPLPGAPQYDGDIDRIFALATEEAKLLQKYNVDALVVENFRDAPFYPNELPAETIASLSAISREILHVSRVPVGINALRNDARAALAVAVAAKAHFIRVNVHLGAMVSDQGILQGKAYETLRLKSQLRSEVLIFADVDVKHASHLGAYDLSVETRDLEERGLVDAIIVSGKATGSQADLRDVETVKRHTSLPVLIGSGITSENLACFYAKADGFIVGSYFKEEGKAVRLMDEKRIKGFAETLGEIRSTSRE